ncbi:MAG: hypothetical protein AB1635_13060 [Acidobacteriota bacterium]
MTRRLILAAALAAFALVARPGASGLAHPGHDHKILGTVTMAASDHVMLKDRDGKDHTVMVNADTKILRDKKPAKIADVKTGMRVVVTAAEEKERLIAKTIEIGAAPATQ